MQTTTNQDKHELLDELDEVNLGQNGLGAKTILTALVALALAVGLTVPKIYLSSSIYYTSLETDSLYSSYKSLKEENKYLEQKLEFMRYKNSVLLSLD
ncbi:MAG: hypothetical protein AB7D29_09470 [Campylobacterales bacterium]